MDTFAHKPKYTLTLPLPIITPKGYPLKLETIGEHIRKKRIDLGLLQQDVAKIIGVSEQTLGYWVRDITEPEIRHIKSKVLHLGMNHTVQDTRNDYGAMRQRNSEHQRMI